MLSSSDVAFSREFSDILETFVINNQVVKRRGFNNFLDQKQIFVDIGNYRNIGVQIGLGSDATIIIYCSQLVKERLIDMIHRYNYLIDYYKENKIEIFTKED